MFPSRYWLPVNQTSDAGHSQRDFSAGGQNDVPAHRHVSEQPAVPAGLQCTQIAQLCTPKLMIAEAGAASGRRLAPFPAWGRSILYS
jgi:hypothetical protein